MNLWCELRNIKISEGKTPATYFSRRLTVPDDVLQLKGRDIPFVNNVTYLGVIFDRRMTWRHHIKSDCSQGLLHVHKELFSIQKWVLYKY